MDIEAAEQLFRTGQEKLSSFYERAPYSGPGMHSTDYHAMIVRDYFIPAASNGCAEAMKECGDYYATKDKERAIKYYRQYLKACPADIKTKALLIAQFGMRLLM